MGVWPSHLGGDIMMAAKASFRVLLRDNNSEMIDAWNDPQAFGTHKYKEDVLVSRHIARGLACLVTNYLLLQISCGDIFEGAPSADAIVRSILAKKIIT